MKLIVGLGNPGNKYKNNRHNVGFMVVERLARLNLTDVVLFKPQKFMNRSGEEVRRWLKKRKGANLPFLYVVHDDLDIELGKFKISFGKGPKEHNGLKSIYEQLGSKDFWHVRVGIENRFPQIRNPKFEILNKSKIQNSKSKISGEEYVLQNFRPEEREIVKEVIEKVVKEIKRAV